MPKTNDAAAARDDRLLWREATRSVKPLPGREAVAPPPGHTLPIRTPPAPAKAGRPVQPAGLPALDRFSGIDRANAERLKRGLHPIEARLDLHGMSQAEAHRALAAFVRQSFDAGRRCVLVITGRGFGRAGPGVLKLAVPRWLEEAELRRQILAIASARPQDGGAGALYVLLRRRRGEPAP